MKIKHISGLVEEEPVKETDLCQMSLYGESAGRYTVLFLYLDILTFYCLTVSIVQYADIVNVYMRNTKG